MTEPNSSLKKFHSTYCKGKVIDSIEVFYKLIEKINELKKKGE